MKFRKKPVIIEANQFHPDALPWPKGVVKEKQYFYIETLNGWTYVFPGDWIITDTDGECYPIKQDIFEATYENVR